MLKLIFLTIQMFINLSNSRMTIKMKSKSSLLLALSFFALFFLAGFTSASVDFVSVTNNDSTVQQGNSVTVSFSVKESGYGNLTGITFNVPITLSYNSYSFNSTSTITGAITSLNQSDTSSSMSLLINVPSDQATGTYTGNLTLTGTYASSVSYNLPISITVTESSVTEPDDLTKCKTTGDNGNLKIDIDDVSVENGFGDDWEWFPLDEISVDVDVQNDGNDDIKKIVLNWGLYNKETEKWIIDGEEDDFKLKDGDDKTVTISFKLDKRVDKLDDGDYVFYVWATGEDEEFDGNKTCTYASDNVNIIVESDFVILDSIQLIGATSCGAIVQVVADVWNIGDDDQEEISVYVYDKGKVLGILEDVDVGDIDAFEKQELSFEFQIPRNAEDGKWYTLVFQVYDEDEEVFQNDYDDDYAEFRVPFKVEGNCVVIPKVSISASLASEAIAGQPLTVKALIKNTDTKSKVYAINAAAYTTWASSAQIDKTTFTLGAGESTEVVFIFDVLKGVSGSQLFNVEIMADGKLEITQPVQVEITKEPGFFNKITGKVISGQEGNWYLWALGALNVVLIVLIIIVAVKASKK